MSDAGVRQKRPIWSQQCGIRAWCMVLPTLSVNETKSTAQAINYSEAEMAIMALSTTNMNIL